MTQTRKIGIEKQIEDISHRLPRNIREDGATLTAQDKLDKYYIVLFNQRKNYRAVLWQSKMFENRALLSGLFDRYYNENNILKISEYENRKQME
jgi:hypothetical protein